MNQLKLPPYQKHRKNHQTFTNNYFKKIMELPEGYKHGDNQVAGHTFQIGNEEVGLLKRNEDASVLKPEGSPFCAAREIRFYETITNSNDEEMQTLKDFLPDYRGTKQITIGNKTINFIVMQDLTNGMQQPCIMDLKIGKQTWDPCASEEKRKKEDGKYVDCKNNLGFCIPGFQTHHILSNSFKKYGRDYGKKLNERTAIDALKIFLNIDSSYCRHLITPILVRLWAIQKWMRVQKKFRFYSSSILIAYDCRKLKQFMEQKKISTQENSSSINNKVILVDGTTSNNINNGSESPEIKCINVYRQIQKLHSPTHNYNENIKEMKGAYSQAMYNLLEENHDDNSHWIQVKMIDFAHTFATKELEECNDEIDKNYLFGLENLINIFEMFLKEC